jgi:dethiobiotin synthetase
MKPIFVTGIDTDAGKSVVSAILVESLKANYWKPVQSGDLENSDTLKVKRLVTNDQSQFFKETYRLSEPMSPHASAAIDGVEILIDAIRKDFERFAAQSEKLVIEGAGGLMVPLSEKDLLVDLIAELDIQVVVVLKNYLGSINHSLLTLEMLKSRGIEIKGVIFNGQSNPESERYILQYSGVDCLGRIPILKEVTSSEIQKQALDL